MIGTLERVADELAIQRVKNEYAWRRDSGDVDGYLALFTSDARTDLGWMGSSPDPAAIRASLEERLPSAPPGSRVHLLANPVIDVDGDEARGRWYVEVHRIDPATGERVLGLLGRYDDRFRRVDGRWLLSFVQLETVWRA